MKILNLQQQDTPVIAKTKELCQAILDQPAYQQMRTTIQAFMSNEEAVRQYHALCDLQDLLHHKQDQDMDITEEEMNQFEAQEQAFLGNPVAQKFIEVQRGMHKLETTIGQYVRKTFELGRMPTDEDFEAEGCGPGCGCGH